ncbi:conserved hypothetical protein [Verticillium alfalfae VaMs.102]|uniref:K Homology domain-containing protein n=1 Tax=Verticillium alfalfae (strain VaMs.102 / ATCC MYA-4576 / FGSC 10136) TaxID=526221 RepID=C9SSS9_VERA1|nr:conserved hypothetical protein [Verticillium alfalfae VaMs.102]EEY21844.1 conserved hypothetical protein [Verticillium alfalfae VaMs.102]
MSTSSNGRLKFEATGQQDVAQQALKDLVQQIGTTQTIKVPIPQSARAHIIGRQGSTIKALQQKSGARIQMPKQDENVPQDDDDDDAVIDVIVEGNAVSAAAARNEILKIVGDRGASATTKLRDIPAQFYPFIAGPNNSLLAPFETDGVQIRVPPYQAWASEPLPAVPNAGQRPTFAPASRDNHISLAGDRASVQAARSAIDRRVQELHDQLLMQQVSIQPGRHQFIIGPRGVTADQFLSETGCAIFLPDDGDNDTITVIGPQQHIDNGSCVTVAFSPSLRRHTNFHANTPRASDGGALPWELYARDGKNALKAQSSISSLVNAFPPSRLSAIPVDPFFHAYLRKDVTPRMTQSHGVHVILPGAEDSDGPVLLVFEGPSATESKPEIKAGAPSADEIKAFQQGIEEASKHILDIINKQENITAASVDVPHKFHERLRRFIKKEQAQRAADQIPVRVSSTGTTVTVRGPASAVTSFETKIKEFVEQEKQDDKERGFTMDFDFPQKFANHLIGKGGSNINELRERFDVEIQVNEGKVELKGPKAKAEAAKAHILSQGKAWADEATHIIKVDPKFHKDLIGSQGSVINRLQTKSSPRILELVSSKENQVTEILEVLTDKHRTLIGRGGETKRQLETQLSVSIDVPRQGDGKTGVKLTGSSENVAKAKEHLASLVKEQEGEALQVPRSLHHAVSNNGQIFRQLRSNHQVTVSHDGQSVPAKSSATRANGGALPLITDDEETTADAHSWKVESVGSTEEGDIAWVLRGPPEGVEKAKASINKAIEEARKNTTVGYLILPDPKTYRFVIGQGGCTVNTIRKHSGCRITVPRSDSQEEAIEVVGTADGVEQAKDLILAAVREGQVPREPRE